MSSCRVLSLCVIKIYNYIYKYKIGDHVLASTFKGGSIDKAKIIGTHDNNYKIQYENNYLYTLKKP